MKRNLGVIVFAAAASVTAASPEGTPAAEVAALLPGTFLSRDSAASVRVNVAAVPKSRIAGDAPVFYLEAAKVARLDAPFLQRFLVLEPDGSRVAVRVFEPRDLAGVRGKWREPESLTLFTARDVRERPDCRITLAKSPAGHWAGGTAAATCFSGTANARLAISMSLSPQTLEWREEGKDAAGKTVFGPSREITIYGREREGAAAARGAAAAPPPAPAAFASPVAGGAGRDGDFSSKVKEAPAAQAPPVLEVTDPSSPSKKYSLEALRAMAGGGGLSLVRLVPVPGAPAAAVVVVTSRSGALSVFSFAEISSSSSPSSSPSLDVSGAAPRLVAAPGRGLEDVVSVELRVLAR